MSELNLAVENNNPSLQADAQSFQDEMLQGVSRTFALTIPQLPESLRMVVGNAYLLCRIADTIEDEPALTADERTHFLQTFAGVVAGESTAESFANSLGPKLSDRTISAEKQLVAETARVVALTKTFTPTQQASIERCIRIMTQGMDEFSRKVSLDGLASQREMDRYCYYVAGVVGEMLTELFCDYCDDLQESSTSMRWLGASFGQGLQMTNILKDVWEDKDHGFCWLPTSVFEKHSLELKALWKGGYADGFKHGLDELVGIAHAHLQNALSFTIKIPKSEQGIRRFCLWAIGFAFLTLRNIHQNPQYTDGQSVKISRKHARKIILMTSMTSRSNRVLRRWYRRISHGLPLVSVAPDWEPKDFHTR